MTSKDVSKDFLAGFSVFLVALPLCLGIALASGAPLFSGLVAGVIGGVVVSRLSGSEIAISGPAAGLVVVVYDAIQGLGDYSHFLAAVVLAGVIQWLFGWLKAGRLSGFVPSSVINGMLVAIGVVIVLKQIPHALGWDADYEGEFEFLQNDHRNTFTELLQAILHPNQGAIIISVLCLVLILWWEKRANQGVKFFNMVPASLVVVLVGVLINQIFRLFLPQFYLGESNDHMVRMPIVHDLATWKSKLHFPAWTALTKPSVYLTAFALAIIASLESMFGLEAADKLDAKRRISSPNQELKAQGIGNILSGLMGGLPLTIVVVRTSLNVYSGGQTRLSAFIQGTLLLLAILLFPELLNHIPLASLAALLIVVGYKLAKVETFRKMYLEGQDQFVPFIVTVVAIVFTDLLIGMALGLLVGIGYVMYTNNQSAMSVVRDKETVLIWFRKDISFLNKARLKEVLASLQAGDYVFIDGARAHFIDHDIYTTLKEFRKDAPLRGIQVDFKGITRRKITKQKSDASLQKTLIGK